MLFEVLGCAGTRARVRVRMRLVWRCIRQIGALNSVECEKRVERGDVVRIASLVFAHLHLYFWEVGEVNANAQAEGGGKR